MFREVAHCGSFTRAGQRVGLSQSAVSRQVQSLETHLGTKLLERTTRSVTPTPAGEFLLEKTSHLQASFDATLNDIRQSFTAAPPKLEVGLSTSVPLAYLPALFHAYRRSHPEVLIGTTQAPPDDLITSLLDRRLGAALLEKPSRPQRAITFARTFSDPIVLLTSPTNPLASASPLTLTKHKKQISSERWILPPENSPLAKDVLPYLAARNLDISPAVTTDNLDLTVHLVSLGLGIALVPRRTLALYRRQPALDVTVINIRPALDRTLVLAVRSDASPPPHIQSLIDLFPFGLGIRN